MIEYTICTKCGHVEEGEEGEELSRFCTKPGCNYMRIIHSQGKDKVWENERNVRYEWSDKEIIQLTEILSLPIRRGIKNE